MKTIRLHIVLAALAFAGTAAVVTAQGPSSSLLSTLEVRKLVDSAEPADHAKLSAHFATLADRFAADANRHTAMSRAYAGSRSPGMATGMQMHCTKLAELSTQSATTLRELSAFHEKLAAGVPAIAPRGEAPFEAGAGARTPTIDELNALAAKASTPADHRTLQEYFQTLARRYAKDAEENATLAQTYRGTKLTTAAMDHDRLAALARDEAKEASAAAAMHEGLAGIAR